MRNLHSAAVALAFVLAAVVALLIGSSSVVSVSGSALRHTAQRSGAAATPQPQAQDPFYADWMGNLEAILSPFSLLDISVPGTHDTMTYSMSTQVADNTNDLPGWLAWLLHEFGGLVSKLEIGSFIRWQARTQGLAITQQLEAGLRFIDFRIDYSAPPGVPSTDKAKYDWFCIHMVESHDTAMHYLQEIKAFLLSHPREVIVMWISHHGNDCGGHYHVDNATQQLYWARIQALFGPLLYNHEETGLLNETSIGTMLQKGQRVVVYLNQISTFVPGGKSPLAHSDCMIDNDCGTHGYGPAVISSAVDKFSGANINARMAANKAANRFYLLSMAGPSLEDVIAINAEIEFLVPLHLANKAELVKKCAATLNTPNVTEWCPYALQEKGQWSQFYRQESFEWCLAAQEKGPLGFGHIPARLPNAVYIDNLDVNGTIRTGPELYFPGNETVRGNHAPMINPDQKYAYVAALLLSNINLACSGAIQPVNSVAPPTAAQCGAAKALVLPRRAQYPRKRWTDLAHGRVENWPPIPPLP